MRDRLEAYDNAMHTLSFRRRVARAREGLDHLDWLRDGMHENGNYEPVCCYCKRTFIGHKRRVVCRECATAPPKPAWQFVIGNIVISLAKPERSEAPHASCHANDDGDCKWGDCPQIRDSEPETSNRHCPLDVRDET